MSMVKLFRPILAAHDDFLLACEVGETAGLLVCCGPRSSEVEFGRIVCHNDLDTITLKHFGVLQSKVNIVANDLLLVKSLWNLRCG